MTGNDSFPPVPAESARRRLALAVLAAVALVAVAAGVVVGAGHGDGGETASDVPSPGRGAPKEHISFLAKIVPPPAESQRGQGSPVPKSVADLARRLPTRAQGRAAVRARASTAPTPPRTSSAGSRGSTWAASCSRTGNYVDVTQLGTLANEAATVAREHHHVPPWVFASQEGGDLNSFPDLPPTAAPGGPELGARGGVAGSGRRRRACSRSGSTRCSGRSWTWAARRPARRSARACTRTPRTRWPPTRTGWSAPTAPSTCSARRRTSPAWGRPTSPPRTGPPRSGSASTSCASGTWCRSARRSTPACRA